MLIGPLSHQELTRLACDGSLARTQCEVKASITDTFVFNSGSGAFVACVIIDPRLRTSVVIAFDFYSFSQVETTWVELGLCHPFLFLQALVGTSGLSLGPRALRIGLRDGSKF